MMTIRQPTVLAYVGLVAMTGCVSVSNLDSARPLKPGHASGSLSAGLQSLRFHPAEAADDSIAELRANLARVHFPVLELAAHYGLSERWKLSSQITIPGTADIAAEYSLFHNELYALALGLGLGGGFFKLDTPQGQQSYRLQELLIPLNASWDIHRDVSLHASLRFLYRQAGVHASDARFAQEDFAYVGLTSGANYQRLIGELAVFTPLGDERYEHRFLQVSLGYFVGYNNYVK